MASDSHAKRPIVVERRKEKGRKKTPRLTKTYDVKIIPATVGVVAETEEPPKKRVAAYCRVSTDQEAQETSLEEQMAAFQHCYSGASQTGSWQAFMRMRESLVHKLSIECSFSR